MTDDAFAKAVEQQNAAVAAMLNGDPGPFIDSWAASDQVTLFGAWGPIEKGNKPVTDTMRWVGSRFTGADVVDVEHTVIASSGDLAYTVGFDATGTVKRSEFGVTKYVPFISDEVELTLHGAFEKK